MALPNLPVFTLVPNADMIEAFQNEANTNKFYTFCSDEQSVRTERDSMEEGSLERSVTPPAPKRRCVASFFLLYSVPCAPAPGPRLRPPARSATGLLTAGHVCGSGL